MNAVEGNTDHGWNLRPDVFYSIYWSKFIPTAYVFVNMASICPSEDYRSLKLINICTELNSAPPKFLST